VNIYVSDSVTDPGWNPVDKTKYKALGTLDASSVKPSQWVKLSLRAEEGKSLGSFRWIMFESLPALGNGLHASWQEFTVESVLPTAK
jgi:hypothetical protein